jgi:hypothetical protein
MNSLYVLLGSSLISLAVGLALKALCRWLRLPSWKWQKGGETEEQPKLSWVWKL